MHHTMPLQGLNLKQHRSLDQFHAFQAGNTLRRLLITFSDCWSRKGVQYFCVLLIL